MWTYFDFWELLRNMSPRKLELAKSFLLWLTDQAI